MERNGGEQPFYSGDLSALGVDKDPQPEIHLRPDRRAKYGQVAVVLAAAQRNHMKKIGFVNTSEFRD